VGRVRSGHDRPGRASADRVHGPHVEVGLRLAFAQLARAVVLLEAEALLGLRQRGPLRLAGTRLLAVEARFAPQRQVVLALALLLAQLEEPLVLQEAGDALAGLADALDDVGDDARQGTTPCRRTWP
jgi:hypothetical protein